MSFSDSPALEVSPFSEFASVSIFVVFEFSGFSVSGGSSDFRGIRISQVCVFCDSVVVLEFEIARFLEVSISLDLQDFEIPHFVDFLIS